MKQKNPIKINNKNFNNKYQNKNKKKKYIF